MELADGRLGHEADAAVHLDRGVCDRVTAEDRTNESDVAPGVPAPRATAFRSTRSVPSGILRRLASVGSEERAFVTYMDLRNVLIEIHTALDEQGVDHVLIGGLALTAHGAARATIDLNFLADGDRDSDVDAPMRSHGYECLHRTENVGNYLSADRARGRVDFLFVRRFYGRAMLQRAATHAILGQQVRVADAADLIGLKVQASSNDPKRRGRDMVDIERLLSSPGVDLDRVRVYFRLFERESELDALLAGEPKR